MEEEEGFVSDHEEEEDDEGEEGDGDGDGGDRGDGDDADADADADDSDEDGVEEPDEEDERILEQVRDHLMSHTSPHFTVRSCHPPTRSCPRTHTRHSAPDLPLPVHTLHTQVRAQAKPIGDRLILAKDRAFLCWNDAEKTSFYPLVLTEDWEKGTRKIKCACLEPTSDKKTYTIDHNWKGDSDKSKDKAFISLIFEIDGEALRPVQGGLETPGGSLRAWRLRVRG